MDRADVQPPELVGRRRSPSSAVTRCRMRSLSSAAAFSVNVKATIDSAGSPSASSDGHPLRDDLGLARAGRGDDLDVAAAVRDRRSGLALEDRGRVRWLLRHATGDRARAWRIRHPHGCRHATRVSDGSWGRSGGLRLGTSGRDG